jgi:pseudaminic acid cytidylyltransferase
VINLCVIPARGGSKRIPRKNIREFCGKPMIAWSIEAAKKSRIFDAIIVSTDDDEIAAVAESCGAMVPFFRPKELSDDHTPTLPVIAHAIQKWETMQPAPSFVCCIYATAPLIDPENIKGAYETTVKGKWNYVFSATSFPYPVFRAIRLDESHAVHLVFPENLNKRSQDFPEIWHDAGQFYWGRRNAWIQAIPILGQTSTIHPIPRWQVQDIDSFEDWENAELLKKIKQA